MEILNKISVKTVVGEIKPMVKEMKDKESRAIMRVIGIANGTKTGMSDNGEWTALIGEFKATNLLTKKEYVSGKCFLPNSINNIIIGQMDGEKRVQFGFDVIVVEDIASQVGYHYNAMPLLQPEENNAIKLLEEKLDK